VRNALKRPFQNTSTNLLSQSEIHTTGIPQSPLWRSCRTDLAQSTPFQVFLPGAEPMRLVDLHVQIATAFKPFFGNPMTKSMLSVWNGIGWARIG
jgi:hypothetical protein